MAARPLFARQCDQTAPEFGRKTGRLAAAKTGNAGVDQDSQACMPPCQHGIGNLRHIQPGGVRFRLLTRITRIRQDIAAQNADGCGRTDRIKPVRVMLQSFVVGVDTRQRQIQQEAQTVFGAKLREIFQLRQAAHAEVGQRIRYAAMFRRCRIRYCAARGKQVCYQRIATQENVIEVHGGTAFEQIDPTGASHQRRIDAIDTRRKVRIDMVFQ
ncbi:hypothetical protein [Herbaspirillum sp. meg3]|uniref:hypothetical protein n=1 Tax=Herbaspirillum sp. meg3 TaxID=2025949 RepID=UPI00351556B7